MNEFGCSFYGGKFMKSLRFRYWMPLAAGALVTGSLYLGTSRVDAAEADTSGNTGIQTDHSECTFFGPLRDHFMRSGINKLRTRGESAIGALTRQVSAKLPEFIPGGSHNHDVGSCSSGDTIDAYVCSDLQTRGIQQADSTNDFEFVRRVTIDLTGRIPTPDQVLKFANDPNPNKRAALVDQLLASPQWVDKWTVFYSDLFRNTRANSQITIDHEGRNSFYKWIHDSLAGGKPYNQMVTEMIAATGTNNITQDQQGAMNFLLLHWNTGGPTQDIYDMQAAGVAEAFLGMAHMNCVLCHNGRGHLDGLSLWGQQATRYQGWQFSSFLSHTNYPGTRSPVDPNSPNARRVTWWAFTNGTTDYALNTTIGNRPARQPLPGGIKNVAPVYIDGVSSPSKGQDYRGALARYVTSDPLFAKAAVNYIWAHFFGIGIVDPPDQFDPARLDINNPPPAPWTLQPSNPKLLDALARHFTDSGFNVRALMREIATSQTYQFSSRYNGAWNPTWEPYFARHFVRRLWSEEIHDSVVTATGIVPTYTVPNFTLASTVYGVDSPGFGTVSYAMQLPDVVNEPDGNGAVSRFLDSFMRGDRDITQRKNEGSILQALNLMNDNFIESRILGTNKSGNLYKLLNSGIKDDQLVIQMYLSVLSRYPTAAELQTALVPLQTYANHTQAAEDVFWALFNKVDFVFNY